MQIIQEMMSYTCTQNLIKYDEKRLLSQFFLPEMFDSTRYDSTKCAPQYELKSFATMATYWVPDLPNIKGFSGIPFWYLLNDAPRMIQWAYKCVSLGLFNI